MRYLNPKADWPFYRVFGEHLDLAKSLLNALLLLTPDQEITELEYLPAELVPDNPLRKKQHSRCALQGQTWASVYR